MGVSGWLVSGAPARWLLYVGVIIALGRGTVAFLDPEWKAGARSVYDLPVPRAFAWVAACSLLLAPVLLLYGQVAALEMARADLPALLTDTSWGHGWVQLAGACLLSVVVLGLPMGRTTSLLLLMASLGVAAAMGGLGHAASDEQWPLGARLLDAMHVAAMGAWIGGLVVTLLITRVPAFALSDAAWRTFSRTATIMAPVTVLTGVGSGARLLLGTPPATILASDYGRLLLGKSVLVLIVLAIGARQRKRIARGETAAVGAVRVECAIAAVVLLITAALTGSEPPAAD